jgi:hypothetical protein
MLLRKPQRSPTLPAALGRRSLIATIREEVLGVSRDPDVGQQQLSVHLLRR